MTDQTDTTEAALIRAVWAYLTERRFSWLEVIVAWLVAWLIRGTL